MVEQAAGDLAAGDVVRVRFRATGGQPDGAGLREAPLSWGQRELWQIMRDKRTWLPIGTALPLPAGTTVDDMVDELRFVMESYPSMRTMLRHGPDGPCQVVHPAGEVTLEVVDAADDEDPAAVAEQVRRRNWRRPLDITTEWPIRMAVVRHRGVLTHRVWVMCHLVTDGTGSRVILTELRGRDTSGSRAAYDAVELAQWQESPAGQRQCQASLRHWERILREVPARRFPPRDVAPYPRFWQAKTDSRAMWLGMHAIADRTGAESSAVLLALFAVALRRVTGLRPVVVQVVVGNRFRPRLGDTVTPVMQNGLCAIDPPDGTVDDVVAHVRRRTMAAYKNAYYDPAQLATLVERVNQDRGETVDIDCFFNDRRLVHRDPPGPAPSAEQVRDAPPGSFEWEYKQDEHEFDHLFVNVDDVPGSVAMTVLADMHYISSSDVEQCVRLMEEIAVASALDPAARALPPTAGGTR